MTRRGFAAAAVVALSLMAAVARAEPNPFGAPGQRVWSGGVALELELGQGAPATADKLAHDFSFLISPSLLHFFARNLAWGVSLDFRDGDYELRSWPFEDLEFGAAVGLGVHVPFNEIAGFFPRLWVGAGYLRRTYLPIALPPQGFIDPAFSRARTTLDRSYDGPYVSGLLSLPRCGKQCSRYRSAGCSRRTSLLDSGRTYALCTAAAVRLRKATIGVLHLDSRRCLARGFECCSKLLSDCPNPDVAYPRLSYIDAHRDEREQIFHHRQLCPVSGMFQRFEHGARRARFGRHFGASGCDDPCFDYAARSCRLDAERRWFDRVRRRGLEHDLPHQLERRRDVQFDRCCRWERRACRGDCRRRRHDSGRR